jgi:uncharacterized protein YjbI with pentapeptide repeats
LIQIKHKKTGEILKHVDSNSLKLANLRSVDLKGADLVGLDLEGADLTHADLSDCDALNANLKNAILTSAWLIHADLSGSCLDNATLLGTILASAKLEDASLCSATLAGVNLNDASLRGANLFRASIAASNVMNTDLSDANLSGADISGALLFGANLQGTDLTTLNLRQAVFAFCDNLHNSLGLETVKHSGPSSLDQHTLRASVCKLPDLFLHGVGYTPEEIEYLRAIYHDAALRYYSCFISFADIGEDRQFADKLHQSLIANNVSNWYFHSKDKVARPHAGKDLEDQLDQAIKAHDKLVLICSQRSIYRKNVVKEILRAIDLEHETGTKKLFPIRLDDHILGKEMMYEAREKVKSGEWKENWVYYVKKHYIPDFSTWKDHDTYEAEFARLLEDLKSIS